MSNVIYNKTKLIELIVSPGQPQANFQPQPFLQGKQIYSLEVFTAEDNNPSPTFVPVVTAAQLKTCYLTLNGSDVNLGIDARGVGSGYSDQVQNVPLWLFHRVQSTAVTPYVKDLAQFMGMIVIWEQSYIRSSDVSLFTSQASILLNVGYR